MSTFVKPLEFVNCDKSADPESAVGAVESVAADLVGLAVSNASEKGESTDIASKLIEQLENFVSGPARDESLITDMLNSARGVLDQKDNLPQLKRITESHFGNLLHSAGLHIRSSQAFVALNAAKRSYESASMLVSRDTSKIKTSKPGKKESAKCVDFRELKKRDEDAKAALSADLASYVGAAPMEAVKYALSEIDQNKWHKDQAAARQKIDLQLSKNLHYFSNSCGVSHCICCYQEFLLYESSESPNMKKGKAKGSNTQTAPKPIRSHIFSSWYLEKVVEYGILAPKFSFVESKGGLQPVSDPTNMIVLMQCANCEGVQGKMEGELSKEEKAILALRCLRSSHAMPGDSIGAEWVHTNFLEQADMLPHDILYKFMVCNVFRVIGANLHATDNYAEVWSLFDRLRDMLHSPNLMSSDISPPVHLYMVPLGCSHYLSAVASMRGFLLYCDQIDQGSVLSIGDSVYYVVYLAPMIMLVGLVPLPELHEYEVHNNKSRYVVLPMKLDMSKPRNSTLCTVLANIMVAMFRTMKIIVNSVIYPVSADTPVQALTAAKFSIFSAGLIDSSLLRMKSNLSALHSIFVICNTIVGEGSEDSYKTAVKLEVGENIDRALDRISFADTKLFADHLSIRIQQLYPDIVVEPVFVANLRDRASRDNGMSIYFELSYAMQQFTSYILRLSWYFHCIEDLRCVKAGLSSVSGSK